MDDTQSLKGFVILFSITFIGRPSTIFEWYFSKGEDRKKNTDTCNR